MKIEYPLLLDGGLSNELEAGGCDLNHKLWSARLLESSPESIVQAHFAYLEAGAKCIITSSYQASVPGLVSAGYNLATAESLILKTTVLAEIAVDRYMKLNVEALRPLIAASIGPYGAYLADGSEYKGDYNISDDELLEFHAGRIKILENTNADLLACETIPSFQEAVVLAEILKETEMKAWLTFSCKDENHLNDGTPIQDCVAFLADHPTIFALGVNCTAPKYIAGLTKAIKEKSGTKKIIVYPNSGEVYDAATKAWANCSDPDLFVAMTKEWMDLGADIIGGCCRIGPTHIAGIRKELTKSEG